MAYLFAGEGFVRDFTATLSPLFEVLKRKVRIHRVYQRVRTARNFQYETNGDASTSRSSRRDVYQINNDGSPHLMVSAVSSNGSN